MPSYDRVVRENDRIYFVFYIIEPIRPYTSPVRLS